ncbi:MAG: ABC transporter permease subunit [Planctomycetota bacterium]
MYQTLTRLSVWAWHLIPANPIVVRVVQGAARRSRYLWLRFGYLGILFCVVLMGAFGFSDTASLADLAKKASSAFKLASIAQLVLMCFLAPVFTAGAITQERDAQTFNILLATPLSNAQIVFGSLLSRLYFVVVLLLAGLPIFFVTMIYGGVTTAQIAGSSVLAGATAALTGSLAIAISMIRVGTRRTIFSFYLMIGLYLLTVYALGTWSRTWVPEAAPNVDGVRMSWLAPFHPLLALEVALHRLDAPPLAALGGRSPVVKYLLAYPQTGYVVLTLTLSFVLTVLSMFFVRRGAHEGEATLLNRLASRILRRPIGERTQKPRRVWHNPIAWREAATRATAASKGLIRYAIIGGGAVAAALVLLEYHRGGLSAAITREWLAGIVMIEFGIILLVATNTAATAITKERESQNMDILLATPLSPKDLVWGKLRGLVSFTVPPLCVPVASLFVFGAYDWVAGTRVPTVSIEVWLELAVLMLAYAALACMLGLHFSLRIQQTVKAVMVSVGVMTLICLIAWTVAGAIIANVDAGGAFLAAFTPFNAISVLVNPADLFNTSNELAAHLGEVRSFALVGTLIAAAVVCGIVAGMYKSMVRNFDMIVRKQSGQ